ncbi:Ig domain protein [Leptospira borgpetersenii serovar Pomona str. 200901868]|uniref:Ig domain protein n=1 Tax=Leptospira borgpetersenii serovar Pomona str. 200901868 TaxID=1192866 RepID=M6W142_LEPBO|nr:Ig domain protein [Leptospira borgpetersenii serovar Pomona str. 200901868]
MKKTFTILLIMGLFLSSCEDKKKEDGSITGNSITDLLLLLSLSSGTHPNQSSNPCPTNVTISTSDTITQIGSSINPLGIQFVATNSSGSTISNSAIIANRNCQFSNYTATNLPAGLSISSNTGAISGIPTAAGPAAVTLSVTFKPNNTPAVILTKIMNMTVHAAGDLTCNTVGISNGCTGANPFSCTNSNSCWTSYSSCKVDSACGY